MFIILIGVGYAGKEYYDFQSTDIPQMEAQRLSLETQITQKQSELKRLQEFARNIEQIKLELRELNLQLESALEFMPRQFNLAGLLRKLTLLAQNSGLELFTFRPSPKEERPQGAFYSTLSIDFDLRGTFTQILVFLDQVSRLKRIINPEQLRLSADGNAKNRTGAMVLTTLAKVKTFRFAE